MTSSGGIVTGGERRLGLHADEILALQPPGARGTVLDLLRISLARFGVIEENPSIILSGPPELPPQFVCLSARAIQRGHRLPLLGRYGGLNRNTGNKWTLPSGEISLFVHKE